MRGLFSVHRAVPASLSALVLFICLAPALPVEAQPYIYVTNQQDGSMSVFDAVDPDNLNLINTVEFHAGESRPTGVAVDHITESVYVANPYVDVIGRPYSELCLVTQPPALATDCTLPGDPSFDWGGNPLDVAITPDGQLLLVSTVDPTDFETGYVFFFDLSTHMFDDKVPVGKNPAGISISSDGTTAYVANTHDNFISVINIASRTVKSLTGGGAVTEAVDVAISPDGKTLLVANSNGGAYAIDVETDTVLGVTGNPGQLYSVAWGPGGMTAYGAWLNGGLWKGTLNPASPQYIDYVQIKEVGINVRELALLHSTGDLYVAVTIPGSLAPGELALANTNDGKQSDRETVGNSPWDLAVGGFAPAPNTSPGGQSVPNNAMNVPKNPNLSWDPLADADTYDAQVATDDTYQKSGASSLVVDVTGLTDPSYQVAGLSYNTTYHWRVRGVNSGGPGPWTTDRTFTTVNNVAVQPGEGTVPNAFHLYESYPNPFNPSATIRFDLPEAIDVRLAVFDALGRQIDTVVSGNLPAGAFEYTWDAGDRASGLYVIRLTAGRFSASQKVVLSK